MVGSQSLLTPRGYSCTFATQTNENNSQLDLALLDIALLDIALLDIDWKRIMKFFSYPRRWVAILLGLVSFVGIAGAASAEVVNVYSARHYDTDITLYERFTEQTGIQVNLIEGGSDALIERILNEGKYSPADILITVDAGRLWRAEPNFLIFPLFHECPRFQLPHQSRCAIPIYVWKTLRASACKGRVARIL